MTINTLYHLSLAQLSDLIPIIGVDFSDSVFLTERNKMILENSFLFFKRELPFDRFQLYAQNRPSPWSSRREEILPMVNNIVGIPLGVEDEKYFELKSQRVDRDRKEIDIFISGEITNTLRSRALDYIEKICLKIRSLNVVIKKTVPFQEYCDLTAKSKVTISIAGSRWECFRHYEAIALGSLPLMNKPTIDATWWHDMPDEIFFENTFDNFTSRLEKLLIDDELRIRCSAFVEKRIENHMLHSKILNYIISTTTEKILNDGWGVQLNKENPGAFG